MSDHPDETRESGVYQWKMMMVAVRTEEYESGREVPTVSFFLHTS